MEWRGISGYEGYYDVSDRGHVRSVRRTVSRGSGTQVVHSRVLKPGITKAGYKVVALCKDGRQHMAYVHLLVLEAFVGPKQEGQQGRHKNGVPRDCRLSNLVWGTKEENERDKNRHGTSNRGARNGAAKLSPRQIRKVRRSYERGVAVAALCSELGVAKRTLYDILEGRTWKHV